jgi:hypothetical protein
LPDLKSSLNEVHLKIPHALKETNYLTDNHNVTDRRWIATTIGLYLFQPGRDKILLAEALRVHSRSRQIQITNPPNKLAKSAIATAILNIFMRTKKYLENLSRAMGCLPYRTVCRFKISLADAFELSVHPCVFEEVS